LRGGQRAGKSPPPSDAKRGDLPKKAAPSAWRSCFEAQSAGFAFFLRRISAAAAAAPNRIVIGGAGTGVPPLDPCHPLDDPDEEPLEDELDEELEEVEELEEPDDPVEVVMLPELEPLVEMPDVEDP
jgi:hypothetical protein